MARTRLHKGVQHISRIKKKSKSSPVLLNNILWTSMKCHIILNNSPNSKQSSQKGLLFLYTDLQYHKFKWVPSGLPVSASPRWRPSCIIDATRRWKTFRNDGAAFNITCKNKCMKTKYIDGFKHLSDYKWFSFLVGQYIYPDNSTQPLEECHRFG